MVKQSLKINVDFVKNYNKFKSKKVIIKLINN